MKQIELEKYLHSQLTKDSTESYLRTINDFVAIHPNAKQYVYQDIVNYMVTVQDRYNGSTPTRILAAIKKYYDFLLETGFRNDHPCKRMTVKVKRRKNILFNELFTSDELRLLLNREERYKFLKERNRALISLFIFQAITVGEAHKIRVSNINFEKGSIYIPSSKKNANRTLLMTPEQVTIMRNYLDVRDELSQSTSDKLFLSIRGGSISKDGINSVIESLKPLFTDRNLNPITIRQSVIANWLNEKKKSLADVQLMSGHRWTSSTERYIRKDIKEQRELINKFHPLV